MAEATAPADSDQAAETNISTFVFLDFESTSLLDRKCRITELCLLAVNRVDMKETGSFPRVTNKLTLCLDPQMPISMTSSNITGLFNDSLEHQKALTGETVALINAFLNHLSKPICLLAHNGNRFDFQLLVAELKRINQSLDELLLCADTLEAFRSLDGLPAKYDPSSNPNSATKNPNSPITNNVTPSKSVTSTTHSPMKRKGANNIESLNNHSPKVSRQEFAKENRHVPYEAKMSLDKAKKKLMFEEIKTDIKKEDEMAVETSNEGTEEKGKAEEFSASLEDADYLEALDTVEKSLFEDNLMFADSEDGTADVSNIKKETEDGGMVAECSSTKTSTKPSVFVGTSCVEHGTGYIVRSDKDDLSDNKEIATEHANTPEKKFQSSTSFLPGSVIKTTIQGCGSPGLVAGTECNSNQIEKVNEATNQKCSTETNFTVTLWPPVSAASSVISTNTVPSSGCLPVTKPCEIVSGCSPVTKACQIGNKDMPIGSRTSNSASSSLANLSSSPRVETTVTNVPSSFKWGSAKTPVLNVSVSSTVGTTLTSLANASSLSESGPAVSPATNAPNTTKLGSSPTAGTSTLNGSSVPLRQSYRLSEIYFRKFGCNPPQAHTAEDDCIALVKIAKCSKGFIEWVDRNAVLLTTVQAPF